MVFDETRLYPASAPELLVLGTYASLAHRRHKRTGPPFIKCGQKVFYSGKHLNEWLEAQTVRPVDDGGPRATGEHRG